MEIILLKIMPFQQVWIMNNKDFLLNLQIGMVKELCSKGLLTEEQTNYAIKDFEQAHEEYIIEKGSAEKWRKQ